MCSNNQTFISRSPASAALHQQKSSKALFDQQTANRCSQDQQQKRRRSSMKRSRGSIESFNMISLTQATEQLQQQNDDINSFPTIEWPEAPTTSSFPSIEWPSSDDDDEDASIGSNWSLSSQSSNKRHCRGLVRSRNSLDLCSMEGPSELFW